MSNTNSPSINAEIVSAPAVSQMTVTPVGGNMFSVNLTIVLVVRFPDGAECSQPDPARVTNAAAQRSRDTPTQTRQRVYADGEKPEAGGETCAFNDFVRVHSYPPSSRQVLADWVQSQT